MAKEKNTKKLRKRDVLIYGVIIAAVLLAVIGAAELIEHMPANSAKSDGTLSTEPSVTTAATEATEAVTTTESTTTEVPATEATTSETTPATEPTTIATTAAPVTTTEAPATKPPQTEAPKTTTEAATSKELEMPEDTAPANASAEEPDAIADNYTETGYNNNIKNIVLIGVDTSELAEHDQYRTGGQSDVIMIVSMNLKTKEFFIVTVNRDLCVPIENYSAIGSSYGWVDEQISLAYAYGDGGRSSGRNVLKSLHKLMGDEINFLGYIAAPIPIVSTVADKVGGVEVYVEDDFSGVDETLRQNTTVNLLGIHAENFVRARMNMKVSNKNTLRMNRQITFMTSFIEKAKNEMSAKQLVDLYTDVLDMVKTDMGKSEITKWIMQAYDYKFTGFYKVDGTEGERIHGSRCTYIEPEEISALIKKLYYKN